MILRLPWLAAVLFEMKMHYRISVLYCVILFSSCTKQTGKVSDATVDKIQKTTVTNSCDTANVSYICSIKPIIKDNCYQIVRC